MSEATALNEEVFYLYSTYLKQKVTLKKEQFDARLCILNNDLSILHGDAGTGKTLTAIYTALELFNHKGLQMKAKCEISNIVICSPIPDNDELGYLRGTLEEKLSPRLEATKKIIKHLTPPNDLRHIENGVVKYYPFSHLRGMTFDSSIVIIDEAQNCTHAQLKMAISRLGTNSKMVLCGDENQVDLKDSADSGFPFLKALSDKIDRFGVYQLTENKRHAIVEEILYFYSF